MNTNVNETKTVATPVEKKVAKTQTQPNIGMSINPENLIVKDEVKTALANKPFSELTAEDISQYQKFPAKVYQDEVTTGFGKSREVKKLWYFAIKLAPTVILRRLVTEDELSAIQALNPKLISNKAIVELPTKCISGVSDGRRFFRVITSLCHSVYFGSSRKNKNNNGFLSNLQVTNLCINNELVKTNPELKKVEFYEVNRELLESMDVDYTDELVNSNDEF